MADDCLTSISLVISPPDILLHIIVIFAVSVLASRGASHVDPTYSGYVNFSLACGNIRSGARGPGFYSQYRCELSHQKIKLLRSSRDIGAVSWRMSHRYTGDLGHPRFKGHPLHLIFTFRSHKSKRPLLALGTGVQRLCRFRFCLLWLMPKLLSSGKAHKARIVLTRMTSRHTWNPVFWVDEAFAKYTLTTGDLKLGTL